MTSKSNKKNKKGSNQKRTPKANQPKSGPANAGAAKSQAKPAKAKGAAYTAPKGRATVSSGTSPGKRKRGGSGWGLVIAGVALVVGIVGYGLYDAIQGGGDGVTDAAEFDLPALGGDGRVALTDYTGQPLVVNFFASWCEQCDAELPDYTRVADEQEGKLNFLFVSSNETGDWRPMADRHDLVGNYDLAADVKGTNGNGLYRSLGGTGGMPMTAFYDDNGQLLDVSRGALIGPALEARLQQLGLLT